MLEKKRNDLKLTIESKIADLSLFTKIISMVQIFILGQGD
jgi:hypothetical protein